jgi:hypothetical protein
VHHHPRTQGKEQEAMIEVSLVQGLAAQKDELPLEFSNLEIES